MGSIARNGILARSKKGTGQINLPPSVDAGVNKVITLPTSSVSVTGTVIDAGIVSTLWSQVSGPSTASIINPILLTTTISNLIEGVYVFRLTATDSQGAVGFDSVTITVNSAVPINVPPIANAGPDQSVQLPSNAILNGSATDSDGTIVSYLWTRVSGPNTPTIVTPSSFNTSVTDLVEGTYIFRLTVTDNNGATDTDDVTVTVFPVVLIPTLNAEIALSSNPTIPITTLSVTNPSTLSLTSASTASVTIGVYQWTKVSGPACTISNPNSVSTSITGLSTGTYVFRLQIWLAAPWESYTDTQDLTVTVSTTTSPTFYVDSISGVDSNDGTSEITAWRSTTKVNSALLAGTIQPGNSVLFKRGQTHYGNINITRSGTSGNPITFGAYGIGVDPILSGFSSINTWVSVGTNLWESSSAIGALSTCNIISINGVNTAYGKMPKSGYWVMDAASQTTITASELNSAVTNWTGADVAIKTARWHLDRYLVTSQSGNVIAFTASDPKYIPEAGWGFFLQNHIKACTAQNDWCYNSTTKKITIYSTTSPTNVKAPILDIGVNLNNYNYIKITNLKFEGYNSYGVFANLSDFVSNTGITVQNCNFSFIGKNAIYTNRRKSNGINVINNNITECNDGGIHVGSTDDAIISDNIILNAGNLLGMGISGDESYSGIVCFAGDNCKVYRNSITNSGYTGIRWDGDGTEIVNNVVINTNYIKDDGGSIYNYPNNGDDSIDTHTKRRLVQGNVVISAPGVSDGTPYSNLEGYCIYNDGNSSDTDFIGNFCYNGAGTVGCFFMNGGYNNVTNNNVFLGGQRVLRSHVVKNITPLAHTYTNNTYVAKESNQYPIYLEIPTSLPSSWILTGNRYAKPIDDSSAKMWVDDGVDLKYTLAAYKALPFTGGKDANATNSPLSVANSSKIVHYYNETGVGKTIALGAGVYIDAKDGSTKTGNIILQPYTGIVLLNTV